MSQQNSSLSRPLRQGDRVVVPATAKLRRSKITPIPDSRPDSHNVHKNCNFRDMDELPLELLPDPVFHALMAIGTVEAIGGNPVYVKIRFPKITAVFREEYVNLMAIGADRP